MAGGADVLGMGVGMRESWWGDGAAMVPAIGGGGALVGSAAALAGWYTDAAPLETLAWAGGLSWALAGVCALGGTGLALGQAVVARAHRRSVGLAASALLACLALGAGVLAMPAVAGIAHAQKPPPFAYYGMPSVPLVAPWAGVGLPVGQATVVYCDATMVTMALPRGPVGPTATAFDQWALRNGRTSTYTSTANGMYTATYAHGGKTTAVVVIDDPNGQALLVAVTES